VRGITCFPLVQLNRLVDGSLVENGQVFLTFEEINILSFLFRAVVLMEIDCSDTLLS
jgi:hypothetical protein